MSYEITNVFVKANVVAIIVRVVESGEEFTVNLSTSAFDAMSVDELNYRIGKIVQERESTQSQSSTADKIAALKQGNSA